MKFSGVATKPPRWGRGGVASILPYLVALAVVLGVMETLAWAWTTNRPLHWDVVTKAVEQGPVDVLFLGTSRVAAAVDSAVFASRASARFGREVRVLNMGIGHFTLAMHYLGTRNLLEKHPDAFAGTTVLIEAPVGLQEAITWRDRWHIPGNTKLLVPLLSTSDIPRLWRSDMEVGEKTYLSMMTLTRGSALLSYRERIGSGFLATAGNKVVSLARAGEPGESADLASAGGIQTDPRRIEDIARAAVRGFIAQRELPENHQPILDWDARVVGDLVRLIEAAGGRVVFFEMPLHSSQATIRPPEVRRADQEAFRAAAQHWDTPVLPVPFDYSDEDFPDVFHLRQSRAAEYTRALFQSWAGSGGHKDSLIEGTAGFDPRED